CGHDERPQSRALAAALSLCGGHKPILSGAALRLVLSLAINPEKLVNFGGGLLALLREQGLQLLRGDVREELAVVDGLCLLKLLAKLLSDDVAHSAGLKGVLARLDLRGVDRIHLIMERVVDVELAEEGD